MPIYEFRCPKCELKFEKLTSHKAVDEVSCPQCSQQPVERLLSVFATSTDNSLPCGRSTPHPSCATKGGFS
jgi:putative FmdB family regulatory protein